MPGRVGNRFEHPITFAIRDNSRHLTLAILEVQPDFRHYDLYCHESTFPKVTLSERGSYTRYNRWDSDSEDEDDSPEQTREVELIPPGLPLAFFGIPPETIPYVPPRRQRSDPTPVHLHFYNVNLEILRRGLAHNIRDYRPATPPGLPSGYFSNPESEHWVDPEDYNIPARFELNSHRRTSNDRPSNWNSTFWDRRRHPNPDVYIQDPTIPEESLPPVEYLPHRHQGLTRPIPSNERTDELEPRTTNYLVPTYERIEETLDTEFELQFANNEGRRAIEADLEVDADSLNSETFGSEPAESVCSVDLDFDHEIDEM